MSVIYDFYVFLIIFYLFVYRFLFDVDTRWRTPPRPLYPLFPYPLILFHFNAKIIFSPFQLKNYLFQSDLLKTIS